ncbi:hypothetical protein EX895_005475 [Sporisorium graminicola]|uniref:ER-bound oxygenase mpaB/mpaB'/Rubber oxygenase catalytic domain-containing protein n=1 Tax=Sporisorium graminicola TaxID=280036 RepID=A0A4U7KML3_9BASI|nr:hypothetical protein EX895_005475 [Sporisorium graminicola]TKY85313.1 hypothetical protein EX895_005475 [Sporisorium graminicola]
MPRSFLAQLAGAAVDTLSLSTLAWTVVVALLLFCIPSARARFVDALCYAYVAIFHRPFRSSPTDFLFSGYAAPLPVTNSTWSRLQASTALKWRAQRGGLRHEKQIDWSQNEVVQHGDMIEAWDRVVEWDQRCLHPHKLEQLRSVGDPLADKALEQVERSPLHSDRKHASTDTLRKIYDQASVQYTTSSDQLDCLTFWKAIDRRPPPGAGALGLDWYESHYGKDAVNSLPHWPQYPSTNKQEPFATLPIWTPHDATSIDATTKSAELQAEAEVIRRGQDAFYRYAGPMLTVLLHFSLAGGFASPRITQVLKQTAYLVPTANAKRGRDSKPSNTPTLPTVEELRETFKMDKARADRTWNRLLETTQFVLDVVEKADSLTPPSIAALSAPGSDTVQGNAPLAPPEVGGDGWQSAVRVRLLHTNVRHRVLKLVERGSNGSLDTNGDVYDLDKNGIPINQEDMLGTLCAFASAPLAMLQRIGVSPSAQERKDYIALWRHIGFYMGIEPALLRCAFADAQAADRTLWCTVLHLFSQVEVLNGHLGGHSQPIMQGPTIPVLIACADRPPFHTPLSAHVAISRRLLGKSLADSLALPASSARREVLSDIAFLGMQVPILFGRFYPRRRWERRRLELARPLLRRLIVFSFGNKRTRFEMPSSSKEQSHKAQGEGERERVNVETQSSEHLTVPEDKKHMMRLAREWRWLMREMVAVLVLLASTPIAFSVYAYLTLRSGRGSSL